MDSDNASVPAAHRDRLARRPAQATRRASLKKVAAELRQYLIDTVSADGRPLRRRPRHRRTDGRSALCLRYAARPLVWDVGHQAYPHKVLTGRRDALRTIKLKDGLAPFPTRGESEYDTFGVGHSSTSISAALGMAIAAARSGETRRVVAVIGDGAMSAGMAFEALNHAGSLDVDMLVILNDNDMSISENVGAFSNYFARVLSGKLYATLREGGKKVLSRMPTVWELARRSEEHMKGMVLPGTIFEEMGFNYIGPIDGHDLQRAGRDADEPARSEGPAVPARDHAQGQGLCARRGRSDQVARPRPVRSEERRHLQGEGERPDATRRFSVNGCATWRTRIRASSASRRRCAKARAWSNSRSAFRIATSTSRSPSSTR